MQTLRLLCARCGTALTPTLSGCRCPRMAACGFGGIVESLRIQGESVYASPPTEA